MKKLLLTLLLFLIVPILYAMPPMPGSGLKHDGSIREIETIEASEETPMLLRSATKSSAAKSSSISLGTKKILVILASFDGYGFNAIIPGTSDKGATIPFAKVHDADYYYDLLQDGTGLTMSEFYQQQSLGAFNISFKILNESKYTSKEKYDYYGVPTGGRSDSYPATFVEEMLKKLTAADVDGVDPCCVIVIHSGPGEEQGGVSDKCIWSHKSSMSIERDKGREPKVNPVTIDGKTFDNYIIVPEYNITNYESTVGVFCHEFGHILGLPDTYDTGVFASTAGEGAWSLMASGSWGSLGNNSSSTPAGSDPAPMLGWERARLGWITETDITPKSGEDKGYTFENINNPTAKLYRVDLGENQYLTLEGKAKNMTGNGMAVPESGLLITQLHNGILKSSRWNNNNINSGTWRTHGSMIVEAKASNYKVNGLGNLWRGSSQDYWFTTTALFRSSTLASVGPDDSAIRADIPLLPVFIDTVIGSGVVITLLVLWYAGRRKLCAATAVALAAVCISMGCVVSGDSSGGAYDTGPNTNYYTSMTDVHSKTGKSGITIYNIKCDENGNGSFRIRKD
ncbi:MAG: M6 family metalloprotease domain-containing protein [Spirochaetia bacterium]|nr:M6 family metalloprotease domain-containing protein [Spirochaetia bacterium]